MQNQLRKLAESIIDSYEIRINTTHSLMAQANQLLISFRLELTDMIDRVRFNLASFQSLRRKDFDDMILDIVSRYQEMEQEASDRLEKFQEQETETIRRLRNVVAHGSRVPFEDIESIREDLLTRQKERELNIIKTLKRFQIEQMELKIGLKRLIYKGENIKIKDLKNMLKAIRVQQNDANENFFSFIDDFDMARNKVNSEWQKVSRMIS